MSDTTLWAPPAEPTALQATLRRAIRAMLPALVAAAQRGPNGPLLQDYDAPQPGRLELRLQGSTLLRRDARDAVKFSLAGHVGHGGELWAVGATVVMDRETRAILALDLATEARRG